MSLSYLERRDEFYGSPPQAEVVPLLLVRRALYRWEAARAESDWAAEVARATPADAVLGRCAAQFARDVEVLAGVAARAVAAWAGPLDGPVTIRHAEGDATRLRVDDAGAGPRLEEVGPDAAGRAFDLVAAEKELIKRSIAAMVGDPAHRARAFEGVDQPGRADPIGYSLGHGSDPWGVAYVYAYSTERLHADGRTING